MDSYTLFGRVVDVAGIMTCQRAHIELQALGVLPEASLENNPPEETAYSSAKVLLERRPDLVLASQTLMNHMSKHEKPYIKGSIQIHRADLMRAEKGA